MPWAHLQLYIKSGTLVPAAPNCLFRSGFSLSEVLPLTSVSQRMDITLCAISVTALRSTHHLVDLLWNLALRLPSSLPLALPFRFQRLSASSDRPWPSVSATAITRASIGGW